MSNLSSIAEIKPASKEYIKVKPAQAKPNVDYLFIGNNTKSVTESLEVFEGGGLICNDVPQAIKALLDKINTQLSNLSVFFC